MIASGGSAGMDTPKRLLRYGGKSLLRRAAEIGVAIGGEPVVVVLGDRADLCRPELAGLPVRIVENSEWSDGLGTSIRIGIEAMLEAAQDPLCEEPEAVVLVPCDQPLLTARHVIDLIRHFRRTEQRIVASKCGGAIGAPALFDRSLFGELGQVDGSGGKLKIEDEAGTRGKTPQRD